MMGIYKITNQINGKSYIGQSVHIERRWQEHKLPSSNSRISLAIKKYGIENFTFEVLEEIKDCSILTQRESYYIKLYNSIVPNGYNIVEEDELNPTAFVFYNQEEFKDIVDKIQNTKLTFDEIAQQYNLNRRTITRINQGYVHHLENVEYPLRKTTTVQPNSYCKDCGKLISKGCKRCSDCSRKASRAIERPSRNELKQLIRTTPFTTIGQLFKVSDNAIRKWCQGYNLPTKKSDIKKYSDAEWLNV